LAANHGWSVRLPSPQDVQRLMTTPDRNVASDVTLDQTPPPWLPTVTPVLQAEDGTYFGTGVTSPNSMDAFDKSGNVKWTVAGGCSPVMATADGDLIAKSPTGQYVTFDQNGVANGMLATLPTYSWIGNWYSSSGTSLLDTILPSVDFADTFATFVGGSPSPSGANVRLIQAKTFAPYGF
jgi:hypothetical protein